MPASSSPNPTKPRPGTRAVRLLAWGRALGQSSVTTAAFPGRPPAGPVQDDHLNLLEQAGVRPRRAPERAIARERTYRRALLVSDVLGGVVALELSLSVVGQTSPMRALLLTLPLLVLLAKLHGLYDRDDVLVRKTTIDELPRLFQHTTLATLLLVLADEPMGIGQTTDTQAAALLGLLLGFLAAGRMLARRLAGLLSTPERCLVLGDDEAAADLRLRVDGRLRILVLDAVPLGDLQTFTDLCRAIDAVDAERVIVVQSSGVPQQQTLELVRAAKLAGVAVSLLPGVLGVVGSQVEFEDVFGVTLLGVRRFGLTRSSGVLKRAFDIAGATAILVFAAPVLALCALLVKLDSRGPALFRQERVGRRGRRFRMIKLRTMVDGAEGMRGGLAARNQAGDGLFKIADDPRLTRVGARLRRLHLDELPQLANVLMGQMSLVGPRPLVTDEDTLITGLDRRRLELTPGMTGPWQIMGGGDRRVPMADMVKLDYLYVASWSLWNDVKILLRTVATVLRRAGV